MRKNPSSARTFWGSRQTDTLVNVRPLPPTLFRPIMLGEAKQAASKMERHALIVGKLDTPLMYAIGSMAFPHDTGFPTQETLQTT